MDSHGDPRLVERKLMEHKQLLTRNADGAVMTRTQGILPLQTMAATPALECREGHGASSSACAWTNAAHQTDVTELSGQIYGGNACNAMGELPRKVECVRCGQTNASYFDHSCPKCAATVCFSCLDDFRLILNSYRCPQCGDQEENQAVLASEMWMLNAYRGAQHAWTAFRMNMSDLLASVDPCSVGPLRRQPVEYAQSNMQLQAEQVYAAQRASELAHAAKAVQPASFGRPPSPPRQRASLAAAPDHQTRPPATWSEVPGAAEVAARWGAAPQTLDSSSASVHGHRTNSRGGGGGTGYSAGTASAVPVDYVLGASRDGRSGSGSAHQTRLPAVWGQR